MIAGGLKTRMTVAVTVLVAGMLLLSGIAGISYVHRQLRDAISRQQAAMLVSLAGQIDGDIDQLCDEIAEIAEEISPALLRDGAAARRFLDVRGRSESRYDNGMLLLSSQGRLIAATGNASGRVGDVLSTRPYFRAVMASGRPCVSEPYVSVVTHHPVVMFAAPVKAPDGTVAGVFGGSIDLLNDNAIGMIGRLAIGRGGYLSLYTAAGAVVMHPDRNLVLKAVPPPPPGSLMARALATGSGSGERVNQLGVPVLSSFRRLPSTNWVLAANYPLAEAYAPVAFLRWYLCVALVAVLAGSIFLVRFLMTRLTAPLARFTRHVAELPHRQGADRFMEVLTGDEIGTLTRAFNGMVEELDVQQEELHKLSCAVEQSPASIVITDTNGIIEYVNPKFTRLTGFAREEAIGQNPRVLKSGELPPEVYREMWRTITAGGEWQGEFHNRKKDGELFWEFARISPVTDAAGTITHFLAIKEDITERKRAEEALRTERQRLYTLLDGIPGFVCLLASDYTIRFANRRFREQFGEIVGGFCYQILHGREEPCGVCPSLSVFETQEPVTWELTDPANRTFQVYDYPFTDMDGTPLVLEMGIDFTELKRTERELRKSRAELLVNHEQMKDLIRKVEAKNRELEDTNAELKATQMQMLQKEKMASIGQLAAGVAHEINNPIGFVASNLGTLEKYVRRLVEYIDLLETGGVPSEALAEKRQGLKIGYIATDSLQLIAESRDGTDRVRKIVADLKSFSRVDEAEYKVAQINDCLESTLNIVWNELKYKATVHREYGELPPVKCYPQQLNQVFMNLLVNAAHAIEKQGEITVTSWEADGCVHVAVKDSGCGIPPEVQQRIFEPFFTTKDVGAGTGLGLSISYDIVKKHGGEIRVESEPGTGTTFTVRLPAVGE